MDAASELTFSNPADYQSQPAVHMCYFREVWYTEYNSSSTTTTIVVLNIIQSKFVSCPP